jgi:hypothetical protein
MRDDNLTVATIEESVELTTQLVDYIHELEDISIHMAEKKKDEWIGGYDGIWMNEEDNNTSQPLRDINYFHMDVQKRSHHELNGVFEK